MQDFSNLISVIQKSQKTLFILCGFPYSGKSYVVNHIKSRTDIRVVSIDDIFKAKGFDWNTNKLPDSAEWQQIFDESCAMVKTALTRDTNVLFDSTNQTLESRNKLRQVADSIGFNTYVLYIKTPIETVWQRWEENKENPTRSVVSKELVHMTIDMFEEPTEDENVIVINNR